MVLSDALISAARDGNLAVVREFLAGGGDPDERITGSPEGGETLLHVVSGWERCNTDKQGRIAIASALLAAGATVDTIAFDTPNTPLLIGCIHGQKEIVLTLCQAGANVNYIRPSHRPELNGDFPLCVCLQYPDIVRILIRFGADVSMNCKHWPNKGDPVEDAYITISLEDEAHRQADHYDSRNWKGDDYRKSARLLKDARLLRPRLRGVFALRALCHRGRATPTSATPAAFARLIGGGASRPRTRAAAKVPASPGLPDPLAHLVCKFWLGEPPRRRGAAPAAE
jgi:ankyrin repeat protein